MDDEQISRRIAFIKHLYEGETLAEAAHRVGRSESTESRWATQWNMGGLEALAPHAWDSSVPTLDDE